MPDYVIEIVEGDRAGTQLPLVGELQVGRDPSADIALQDNQVSRRHARLLLTAEGPAVEDTGSRNGTYVNGQITHGQRRLVPGDQVRVGLSVLEVRTARSVAAEPSAVRPAPQISAAHHVLQPAAESELPAPAPQSPSVPQFAVEESEPAFVPREVVERASGSRSGRDELAALIDSRVKRQTNVAAFAFLAISALAVIIYFGAK